MNQQGSNKLENKPEAGNSTSRRIYEASDVYKNIECDNDRKKIKGKEVQRQTDGEEWDKNQYDAAGEQGFQTQTQQGDRKE